MVNALAPTKHKLWFSEEKNDFKMGETLLDAQLYL